MRNNDSHLTDEEIIQAADGELSTGRTAQVQAHFAGCWRCRTRKAELEAAIKDFVHAHNQSFEELLPPIDGPRSMLRARMAELTNAERHNPMGRIFRYVFDVRRVAYIGLFAGVVIVSALFLQFRMLGVRASFTPDPSLTPGLALGLTKDDVCSTGNVGLQPVPTSVAYEVFQTYGISNPEPRSYELDHLITPALGGAIDVRNLWPQPYTAGVWNAHVKDALEDHLHQLVCTGQLDLTTAQQEISSNWIAAYKKYFGTDHPLPPHLTFSKDRPWE